MKWFFLISNLLSVALIAACATSPQFAEEEGTGQLNADESCRNLPSLSDCKLVAAEIQNTCLRKCVLQQCEKAFVLCGEAIEQMCKERSRRHGGAGDVAGFSQVGTCQEPHKSIFWCSREFKDPGRARECQRQTLVHEFAHTCGFRHDNQPLKPGQMYDPGVPGHEGKAYDCEIK